MELSFEDWHDIIDTVNRYAEALDSRNWKLLNDVFVADAVDHSGGRLMRGRESMVTNIQAHLGGCGPSQHLLGNFKVQLESAAVASCVCRVRVYHVGLGERAQLDPFECWGFYHWRLAKRQEGWRITDRTLDVAIRRGDINVLQPG